MNKYEKYKKVDLPWIDNIPSSWKITKVNSVFEERREKVSDKEYEPLSVTKMGVLRQLQNVAKTNSGDNRKKVLIDDFVINSRSDRKGSSGLSEYNGSVSLINIVLKIKNEFPKYIHYLLKSVLFQEEFYRNGKGIVADLWSTNFQNMKNIYLPIPSFSEQQQIANYLDWKIEMIDEIIQIEKQKIERIETLKQKYIDNIFDSLNCGKYIRLAKLGNFSKGGGFSRENLTNSANEAILYGDIYTKYNYWLEKCISNIDDKGFKDAKHLQEPAVLFTASGETKEDIGKAVAFIGNHKIAVGGDVIIFRVKKDINVKYISYFCNTSEIKYEKYIESSGEIIVHISSESLKNIKIPFITIEEQEDIVSKIDSFIELQNKIISSKNIIIKNYMKLKQSLISEVVTGQIDVRNVKIPERK